MEQEGRSYQAGEINEAVYEVPGLSRLARFVLQEVIVDEQFSSVAPLSDD